MASEVLIVLIVLTFATLLLIKFVIYLYEEIKVKLSCKKTEDENPNILSNQISTLISPNIDICKLIVSHLNFIPINFRLDLCKPNESVQYCNKNWNINHRWENSTCPGSRYSRYANIFIQVSSSSIFVGNISEYRHEHFRTVIEISFNNTANKYLTNAFLALEENKHDVAIECAKKAWSHSSLVY